MTLAAAFSLGVICGAGCVLAAFHALLTWAKQEEGR